MKTRWFPSGMFLLALAVAGGAFGAHGLRGSLSPEALALWETAMRYLLVGAVALALVGLAAERMPERGWTVPGWLIAIGTAVFSATVAALALGMPRWLGAVTPIGGVLLIGGLALAARAGRRS